MTETFLNSETVNDLIEPVQKILAANSAVGLDHYQDLKGVKTILQIWKKNKNWLYYGGFSNYNIVEFGTVSISLTAEQKESLAKTFVSQIADDIEELFPEYIQTYDWDDVSNFVVFLKHNLANFFDNKTYEDFEAPDGTIIGANTKISKSFKHFFQDETMVRKLQDKYSEIIQQDKMTGTLCASIHPLDFLSSSENNYKWRSCHALNGDYANGNLSYMMDECTIIFYLKGAENVKLPRFPDDVLWNDKKWRMLVFVSPHDTRIAWAGRQYPFFSKQLLDLALDGLNELVGYHFNSWSNTYLDHFLLQTENGATEKYDLYDSYIYHNGTIMTREQLIKDAPNSTHYNDLVYSSFYTPYYSFSKYYTVSHHDLPIITIGHAPVCAKCGNIDCEVSGEGNDKFICEDCTYKLYHRLVEDCDFAVEPIEEYNLRDFLSAGGYLFNG